MESRALAEALDLARTPGGDAVISTGGGIVLSAANRALLLDSAMPRIYLRCTAEELWKRIAADKTTAATRPNLTAAGGIEEVRSLLALREPLYREVMSAEVDVTKLDVEDVVAVILGLIRS